MSDEIDLYNKVPHKISLWLLITGNSLALLGLLLIPSIVNENFFIFNLGAYLFIFGMISTFIGLLIITLITLKIF